jgi:hypothetical protein
MTALLAAALAVVLAAIVIRALGPSRTLMALGAVALLAAALTASRGYGPQLLAAVTIAGTVTAATTGGIVLLLHKAVIA